MDNIPLGIKYTKFVNTLTIAGLGLSALITVVLTFAGIIPGFFEALGERGGIIDPASILIPFVTGAFFTSVWVLPIPFLFQANRSLGKFEAKARKRQVILSCILMFFFFPLSTIAHAIAIFFMVADDTTKNALKRPSKNFT